MRVISVLRWRRSETEIQWRHASGDGSVGIGGQHVAGRLHAPETIDASDQEDVPTADVRAPGRAVADADATAREPVTTAGHQGLAQQ